MKHRQHPNMMIRACVCIYVVSFRNLKLEPQSSTSEGPERSTYIGNTNTKYKYKYRNKQKHRDRRDLSSAITRIRLRLICSHAIIYNDYFIIFI